MSKERKTNRIRLSVMVDRDLLLKAENLSEGRKRNEVVREALTALVQRESGRRLALLGGDEVEFPAQTPEQCLSDLAREVQRACEEAELSLKESLFTVRQVLEGLQRRKKG